MGRSLAAGYNRGMSSPDALDLGLLPTPLHRLERAGARLGVDLWAKRDDLSGFGLSGNKVRKLRFLLAEARAQGADTVLTCGGIQSNHCRATAIAARQVGMAPGLLLRGTPPLPAEPLDSNLLINALVGAELRWVDTAGWQGRDARLAAWARDLEAEGRHPYLIPEGGSNALGSLGFADAGQELVQQCEALGIAPDTVVHATGSGGTLAGLAMSGIAPRVLGVAVCDDRDYFVGRVQQIAQEAAASFGRRLGRLGPDWEVLEGFKGPGYALSTPQGLRAIARLAQEEGLLLDPVYTGKAWAAVEALAPTGALGRTVVFWHTGGAFGLFGRGDEFIGAMDEELSALGYAG